MNLVFDFDGSITVKDTIGELADAAIAFHKAHQGIDLREPWNKVVQDYQDDLRRFHDTYRPLEGDRRDVDAELLYLSSLRDVENASLDRVEKSGLFAGLKRENLFQMGAEKATDGSIAIRDGLCQMLQLADRHGWQTSILSVHWSRAFIEGVLHHHDIKSVVVLANEVTVSGGIQGPDILGRRLTVSPDKVECLARFATGDLPTIYFGDSPTDLGCLHHRGIVIAADEESPLMKTLSRAGLVVPHVAVGSDHHHHHYQGGDATVFWARDFREVLESQRLQQFGSSA